MRVLLGQGRACRPFWPNPRSPRPDATLCIGLHLPNVIKRAVGGKDEAHVAVDSLITSIFREEPTPSKAINAPAPFSTH